MKTWFDDIDDESLDKASEFPPQIPLPADEEDIIIITIKSESETVKGKERDMEVVTADRISPEPIIEDGSFILAKSLRFNMAKALKQANIDHKKFKLTGSSWRIWATHKEGRKHYHCEMM